MPYTTVTTNQVLTSTFLNTNYRDQVVSTVTSGTRPTGTEGQVIVETDTDELQIYSGSGWVDWGQYGAWTAYTPTQTGATGSTTAAYIKHGRLVTMRMKFTASGAGAGTFTWSVPFNFAAGYTIYEPAGYGFADNLAGTVVLVQAIRDTASTVRFVYQSSLTALGTVAAGAPFVWAASRIMCATLQWEAST